MKHRKPSNNISALIPTSSFADIAFLLLVFFMLTSVVAITRGLFHKVPKQEELDGTQKSAIYIYINETGGIFIDKKPAKLSDIKTYCREKIKVNPNKPVMVHCRGAQKYQTFIIVLDKIKQLENELYGEYNKDKKRKDQKRIYLVIPSLEEI